MVYDCFTNMNQLSSVVPLDPPFPQIIPIQIAVNCRPIIFLTHEKTTRLIYYIYTIFMSCSTSLVGLFSGNQTSNGKKPSFIDDFPIRNLDFLRGFAGLRCLISQYPLVNIQKTMENHHC